MFVAQFLISTVLAAAALYWSYVKATDEERERGLSRLKGHAISWLKKLVLVVDVFLVVNPPLDFAHSIYAVVVLDAPPEAIVRLVVSGMIWVFVLSTFLARASLRSIYQLAEVSQRAVDLQMQAAGLQHEMIQMQRELFGIVGNLATHTGAAVTNQEEMLRLVEALHVRLEAHSKKINQQPLDP